MKIEVPDPECRLGYTLTQLDEMLGQGFVRDNFEEYMWGQTRAICGGQSDGGEPDEKCEVAHGLTVYWWDFDRWAMGRPVID